MSKLGRTYRIPKENINLLLWATRTRDDVMLKEYTGSEIAQILKADELDKEAQEIAQRFLSTSVAQFGVFKQAASFYEEIQLTWLFVCSWKEPFWCMRLCKLR